MAKLNDPRRRLTLTPNLKLSREHLHIEHATGANGPTSPPETPTTSPHMVRKPPKAGDFYRFSRTLSQDPNIKPVGNGHQFSYQRRVLNPEQLSPRSSSSSSGAGEDIVDECSVSAHVRNLSVASSSDNASVRDDDGDDSGSYVNDGDDADDVDDGDGVDGDDEEEEEEEENDDEADNNGDDHESEEEEKDSGGDGRASYHKAYFGPCLRLASADLSSRSMSLAGSDAEDMTHRSQAYVASLSGCLMSDFVIEDVDPMDSGCEGLETLYPTEIESNRSRSRSLHKECHRGMVRDFKNLNCSNETFDNEDGELDIPGVDEESLFRQRQKEIRRIRRVSMSSSFGKRTHSELSDSGDSDVGTFDVNEVGSSARRMRKRQHRGNLLFQDPPAPRIDELEEPDSCEEDCDDADTFARELPYWTMEIMEMDTS